jgi:hypothetical protein
MMLLQGRQSSIKLKGMNLRASLAQNEAFTSKHAKLMPRCETRGSGDDCEQFSGAIKL